MGLLPRRSVLRRCLIGVAQHKVVFLGQDLGPKDILYTASTCRLYLYAVQLGLTGHSSSSVCAWARQLLGGLGPSSPLSPAVPQPPLCLCAELLYTASNSALPRTSIGQRFLLYPGTNTVSWRGAFSTPAKLNPGAQSARATFQFRRDLRSFAPPATHCWEPLGAAWDDSGPWLVPLRTESSDPGLYCWQSRMLTMMRAGGENYSTWLQSESS